MNLGFLVLLLCLIVVVVAGNSLVRKGRWSRTEYQTWVIGTGFLCLTAGALFLFRPVHR